MDPTLSLHPLSSVLPLDEPFTPVMARAAGLDRRALERLVREEHVRRLLRGVYAARTAADTPELRAAAVRLALQGHGVAVDRTAAWVHGVPVPTPVPLDVIAPAGSRRTSLGGRRHLLPDDVVGLCGARLTTPLRTALDLGRLLAPDHALGVMDHLLRGGSFTHAQLLAQLPRLGGHRGAGQLRALAAQVDARSCGMAESSLRLHWHAAALPTATPGLQVATGSRLVRLTLGVPRCQFGAVLAHQVIAADLLALESTGWRVVVLPEERVLSIEPQVWVRHLVREFHQHLLAQSEAEGRVG